MAPPRPVRVLLLPLLLLPRWWRRQGRSRPLVLARLLRPGSCACAMPGVLLCIASIAPMLLLVVRWP